MSLFATLISRDGYFNFPNHIVGWIGWLLMLLFLAYALRRWWEPPWENLKQRWWLAILLLAATFICSLFFGVRLPGNGVTLPGVPLEAKAPAMMILGALPWVLAAGYLGPLPATLLAAIHGLTLGYFETYSIFTPLEMAGLGLIYSIFIRQRYRTTFFKFIRHPMGALVVLLLAYPWVFLFGALFSANGSLAVRMDFALTQNWFVILARFGELLLASVLVEWIYLIRPEGWGRKEILQPSPLETSLQTRFFFWVMPLVAVLMLTLLYADWWVAGAAAQNMLQERLSSTAKVAADSLPYFMEAGQNLILTLAQPELVKLSPEKSAALLPDRLRSVPFFRQLTVIDARGKSYAGYPLNDLEKLSPSGEERNGINLALKGVLVQTYVLPPVQGEHSAQISFLAAIRDENGQVLGVLLGRTDLNSNPFTQAAIHALEGIKESKGQGLILDENQRILYHPDSTQVMTEYIGTIPDGSSFFTDSSATGTRRFVYYQPVVGRPWAVVMIVPAQEAQQLALNIAIPLLVMLLILAVLSFLMLRLALRMVTSSLQNLAQEVSFISQGQLDRPLVTRGVDEVGRLSRAFENMRVSLKARLDELNRLLVVTQGVAANLEIEDAVRPVLDAALADGASCARMVLVQEVVLDPDASRLSLGVGPASDTYAYLDEQLFELVRTQDMVNLSNVSRARRVQFPSDRPAPVALLALPIRHENRYYGVFWVAYNQSHNFSDAEVRFLSTLSSAAALAASNARLYTSAEVGRQRLEAVLNSTPEPVLVIDRKGDLLLLNPAAIQVPGLISSPVIGHPIRDALTSNDLVELLQVNLVEGTSSREIHLANNRVYFSTVSPVLAEGQLVGKVCVLRDITYFKELDTLKSDFVATVSHDLRSPLTLTRGYTTMLKMMGELNEQQTGYVDKILGSVESMNRLVNNLLDLGRIDAGIGLKIQEISVYEVIEQVTTALQPNATQKNLQFEQEPAPAIPVMIEADRDLVHQAFYNLVENAIKYTPVNGQVKVRLEVRPKSVVFSVQDTGIGVAPLDLPRLFEKFFRSGRREAYQQRGSGLGLAIVKSIAERHGGRVWVESQLGRGSLFSIELPLQQVASRGVN